MAVTGWEDCDRVAVFDPSIERVWTADPASIAESLEQSGGYAVLNAKELKRWLALRIEKGAAGTICAFLQGVVPKGIADEPFDQCPARRYMMAGGRIVWIGYHIPFGC